MTPEQGMKTGAAIRDMHNPDTGLKAGTTANTAFAVVMNTAACPAAQE